MTIFYEVFLVLETLVLLVRQSVCDRLSLRRSVLAILLFDMIDDTLTYVLPFHCPRFLLLCYAHCHS